MAINKKSRALAASAAAVLIALVAAGCSGGADAGNGASGGGTIKIGGVFPLTGGAAANGDWAKLGAEIAVDEINENGGIDGRQVELVLGDDELTPTKSVTEMTRLINQEKVDVVLGPLASDPVLATLPLIQQSQTPNIMGAGSEKVTPDIAPYSFSWTMNASTQATEMVNAAIAQGAKSVAILNDAGTQGRTAAGAMMTRIEEAGLTLTGEQEMTIDNTDLTPQLLSLRGGNPDALLLFPVTSTDTGRVLQQLDQLDWDVPVVGSYGTTFADAVKKIAGEDAYKNTTAITFASFSACSTDTVPETTATFVDRVNAFDEKRASTAAFDGVAQTYDAVYLMKAAIEATGGTDAQKISEWIMSDGAGWAKGSNLVNQSISPSAKSHFLYGPEALALVNPGTQVAPSIFQRVGC